MTYRIQDTNYENLSLEEALKIGLKKENIDKLLIYENILWPSWGYRTSKQTMINKLCSDIKHKVCFILESIKTDYIKYVNKIKPFINDYDLRKLDTLLKILSLVMNNLNDIDSIEEELNTITKDFHTLEDILVIKYDNFNLNEIF